MNPRILLWAQPAREPRVCARDLLQHAERAHLAARRGRTWTVRPRVGGYRASGYGQCDEELGGGYRHQSKMFTGRNALNGGAVWSPSFWNSDALRGYTVRGWGKGRKLSFQLNVFNVFDDRDPLITRYEFVGDQQLVFRSIPQPPRTWRFTTNFEF